MNGEGLATGSLAGSRLSGGWQDYEVETCVNNKLAEVRGFVKSNRGRFDEVVQGGWIQEEDVEAFFKDPFESVEARIISSGEGKVMVVMGGAGDGVKVMESSG